LYVDAVKFGVEEDEKFYREKIREISNKKDDGLFQLVTFEEFENYADKIFSKVKGKGIVLSVCWFDQINLIIGWGWHEIEKVNQILKVKAEEYNLKYIDLWSGQIYLTIHDGVHLTPENHKYVAGLIDKAIKEIESNVV
jgi:lysophospholipase L1-like esterase